MSDDEILTNAAKTLDEELRQYKWYLSVGVGTSDDFLFVYTNYAAHENIAEHNPWLGKYELIPVVIGIPLPLNQDKK